MSVGYRAILRLSPDQDSISVAEEHLRSWLREKRDDKRNAGLTTEDWEGAGIHSLGPEASLHVVHVDHAEDFSKRHLYRLVERNSQGTWIVSMYAASLPKSRDYSQTIVVEGENVGVDREAALLKVATPRVVRSLLDQHIAKDGSTRLSGTPQVIRSQDIGLVLDAIRDEQRTASVIVAASPSRESDANWQGVIRNLTAQSVGVATTFVVVADAVDELNAALPQRFHTKWGHVRTYLPKLRLDDPGDARRHPWLGPAALANSLDADHRVRSNLQYNHALAARRRFVVAKLPGDVRRTMDLLQRAETTVERAAEVAKRTAPSHRAVQPLSELLEAALEVFETAVVAPKEQHDFLKVEDVRPNLWVERIAASIKRWLKIERPEPVHLDRLDAFIGAKVAEVDIAEEQLDAAAERERDLEFQLEEVRARLENLQLDQAEAEHDNIEKDRELTILRTRIAASEHPQDAYVAPESDTEWQAPSSIRELIERLTPGADGHPILRYVEFSGDASPALDIDIYDPVGTYAERLWEYARVLYSFAEARVTGGFHGGVHMYLKDNFVDGHKCSPERHAAKESDSVLMNKKWRNQRVLPVPTQVAPDGTVLMEAHFKPTHRDQYAPRMHYYEDLGRTGKIYIGYIGRHLDNSQS